MKPTVSSNGVGPKAGLNNEARHGLPENLARKSGQLTNKAMHWLVSRIRQWEKRPLARRKREVIGLMVILIGLLALHVYLTLHQQSDEAGARESSLERLYEGARQRWQSMPQHRP